jgi:hypothetical protein
VVSTTVSNEPFGIDPQYSRRFFRSVLVGVLALAGTLTSVRVASAIPTIKGNPRLLIFSVWSPEFKSARNHVNAQRFLTIETLKPRDVLSRF